MACETKGVWFGYAGDIAPPPTGDRPGSAVVEEHACEALFAAELEHGADIRTDQLLEHAERAARKGKAASIRWLARRFDAARAARIPE